MHSGYSIYKIPFINKNPNPSIEVNKDGYLSLSSTETRDIVEYYKGVASLKSVTSDLTAMEGHYRIVTTEIPADVEHTFSAYLKGSGTVRLAFWDDVLGYQDGGVITLTSTWTRYSLTKTFDSGSTVRRLYVVTDVQQSITFYTDALQHEESATASVYTENKISEVVDIGHYSFISFILPVLDDGDITFQVSELENGDYVDLKKVDDSDVSITAGTGNKGIQYVDELAGHRFMRMVSAIQQTADRNIKVIRKWR